MKKPKLEQVHARLFPADVRRLKQISAQTGAPWLVELRLLVRRALRGEERPVIVIDKEKGS